jgi:hypothetical protein
MNQVLPLNDRTRNQDILLGVLWGHAGIGYEAHGFPDRARWRRWVGNPTIIVAQIAAVRSGITSFSPKICNLLRLSNGSPCPRCEARSKRNLDPFLV